MRYTMMMKGGIIHKSQRKKKKRKKFSLKRRILRHKEVPSLLKYMVTGIRKEILKLR
jgi:hypothetical protein